MDNPALQELKPAINKIVKIDFLDNRPSLPPLSFPLLKGSGLIQPVLPLNIANQNNINNEP